MTKKSLISRSLYVRITDEEGKRVYAKVGLIYVDGDILLLKGMPNPGWWRDSS